MVLNLINSELIGSKKSTLHLKWYKTFGRFWKFQLLEIKILIISQVFEDRIPKIWFTLYHLPCQWINSVRLLFLARFKLLPARYNFICKNVSKFFIAQSWLSIVVAHSDLVFFTWIFCRLINREFKIQNIIWIFICSVQMIIYWFLICIIDNVFYIICFLVKK